MGKGKANGFAASGWRLLTAVWVCVALLGVAACGKDGGSTATPDAKKAAAALQAGLAAQSKGKLDEAANHYNEVLKYDKKNKYALYDLALVDAARSNYGDAEDKYRVVLGIDPKFEPALFNLAILVKAKGNDKEAISLYKRAVVAAPRDAAAHLNLGLLLRANGQVRAGNAEVKKASTLNPTLRDPAVSTASPASSAARSSPAPGPSS